MTPPPLDVGERLDMKLLEFQPRPPRQQHLLRTVVRAVVAVVAASASIGLLYGYLWVSIAIAVDHRQYVWPWIGATFVLALGLCGAGWLADLVRDRRRAAARRGGRPA